MPGGDRTGPLGMGPRTGRAAGFCSGSDRPGYADARGGRGQGMGLGRGRRFRNFVSPTPANRSFEERETAGMNPEAEIRELTRQAQVLQTELSSIQKRLAELDSQNQ